MFVISGDTAQDLIGDCGMVSGLPCRDDSADTASRANVDRVPVVRGAQQLGLGGVGV